MKWLMIFSLLFGVLFADAVEFIKDGPIHEAFVTNEAGKMILQAVPLQPPPSDLSEQIPPRREPLAQWIHGYWSWSSERSDFIWVSGVWRRAPPGMIWVHGKWEHHEEGFVWLPGFWSKLHEADLDHYSEAPPDLLDEKVPGRPGKDYFWVPGYWKFDEHEKDYVWQKGRWHLINEQWQFVPAHYMWRQNGYIFIPSYWDWPIDVRGSCYAAAYVDPDRRATTTYEPSVQLQTLFLIEHLYPDWPSYSCLFYHHYYYHMDIWIAWGAVPPWWHWDLWWSFAWQDTWWLWWWWTHPGYSHPFFLEIEMAAKMSPPKKFVLEKMDAVRGPFIITGNGVVGSKTLISAIFTVTGHKSPVLPADPKMVGQIQEVAYPLEPGLSSIRPSGHGMTTVTTKPFFGPTHSWLNHPPGNAYVPPYPVIHPDLLRRSQVEAAKPIRRPPTYKAPPPDYTSSSKKVQPIYPRKLQRINKDPEFRTNIQHPSYYKEKRDDYYPMRPDIVLPKKPGSRDMMQMTPPKRSDPKNTRSTSAIQGNPRETKEYQPLH